MTVCAAPCPIVFDLDGTLIDSAPDIHAAVNAVLRDLGARPLTLDQVRSFIGGGVDVLWQKITRTLQLDPNRHGEYVAAFMSRYHDTSGLTRMYPGTIEALGQLADRGYPLGICTNKPLAPTRAILGHFGILGLFGTIIGGDSLPEKKPDPAPLRAALRALGADPDRPQALYVGDSEYDATCAAAVPVPFLIFTRGYRRTPVEELPHLEAFDDFARLPVLVESAQERMRDAAAG